MMNTDSNSLELLNNLCNGDGLAHQEIKDIIGNREIYLYENSDYSKIQEHSNLIDKIIDINVNEIEGKLLDLAKSITEEGSVRTWGKSIHDGVQTYVGLNPEQLQTPYSEFYKIIESISPEENQKVVDLGAGYGRLGLICHAFDQSIIFEGHEYAKERVDEGNRIYDFFEIENSRLVQQDLSSDSFDMPNADIYFMYEYGDMGHVQESLRQLQEISKTQNFRLVCRGKGSNNLIWNNHPWLTVFNNFECENSMIYSSYSF